MKRKLSELLSPVPSDIDIAQSVDPLPITDIAADIGLELDELVLYGQHTVSYTHLTLPTSDLV